MAAFVTLATGSLVAWGAWGYVLATFDPFTGGWTAKALFYASLGLALLGTLMLCLLFWHFKRTGIVAAKSDLGVMLRQAVLLVGFVIVLLNLAGARLLRWWNILPLILLTVCIELFFHSLYRPRHQSQHRAFGE